MDPQEIADVLGGLLVDKAQSEHPHYSIRVVDLPHGIRLRLELAIRQEVVRLFVERFGNRGPHTFGAMTVDEVRSISAHVSRGEVHFMGKHTSLTVTREATFTTRSV